MKLLTTDHLFWRLNETASCLFIRRFGFDWFSAHQYRVKVSSNLLNKIQLTPIFAACGKRNGKSCYYAGNRTLAITAFRYFYCSSLPGSKLPKQEICFC
jgi:hypothetical protein